MCNFGKNSIRITYSIKAVLLWQAFLLSFQLNPSLWYRRSFSSASNFSRQVRVRLDRASVGQSNEQPNEQQQHKQPSNISLTLVLWWSRNSVLIRPIDAWNSSFEMRPIKTLGKSVLNMLLSPNKVMLPSPVWDEINEPSKSLKWLRTKKKRTYLERRSARSPDIQCPAIQQFHLHRCSTGLEWQPVVTNRAITNHASN